VGKINAPMVSLLEASADHGCEDRLGALRPTQEATPKFRQLPRVDDRPSRANALRQDVEASEHRQLVRLSLDPLQPPVNELLCLALGVSESCVIVVVSFPEALLPVVSIGVSKAAFLHGFHHRVDNPLRLHGLRVVQVGLYNEVAHLHVEFYPFLYKHHVQQASRLSD